VNDIDFDAPDFFRTDAFTHDPYPYYDHLREQCPVVREPHHGVYMVTGYEEAIAVYNDTATFSSCNAVIGPFATFPVALTGDDVSDVIEQYRDDLPFSDQVLCFDPPKHTDHRALLMRLITPKRLKENEEFMWRLADQTIDEFHGRGECEFITEYAGPFTLLVIADLLGVPATDHEAFRARLTRRAGPNNTVGSTHDSAMSHTPLGFLYDQFTEYLEDRRREPRDDVLNGLAHATFPDGSLPSVGDAMRIAVNLFSAGQETTARLLGTALQSLAERPDLQQRLRDDRSIIPAFLEESLRLESPIKGDFRLARVSTKVSGVDIPAGSTVMLLPGATNRDPREFDDPAELSIDRANGRQHLAFGRGVHTCPGSPLARSEARITLERVLDRMADIRISDAHHGPPSARRYEYAPTYMLRGLQELHLEFTPVG